MRIHELGSTVSRQALSLAVFFLFGFAPLTESAQSGQSIPATEATPEHIASVTRLLTATGLPVTINRDRPHSWVVTVDAENVKREVGVTLSGDLVVIDSVVTRRPSLDLNQAVALLGKNLQWDLVKVGLDDEGSLAVLSEVPLSGLDPSTLRQTISRVVVGANGTAGLLKAASPGMTASNPPQTLNLLQGRAVVRYDPARWTQAAPDKAGIFTFRRTDDDLGVKVLAERIEVPAAQMRTFVLGQVQKHDPAATIAREGWREVNGARLLWFEIEATVSGVPVTYYSHCYNGPNATIQLIGYTGRSLMSESRPLIEQFVSGFEVASR